MSKNTMINVSVNDFNNAIKVKRIDLFQADKNLKHAVVNFWKARIIRAEYAERTRLAISECQSAIKTFQAMIDENSKLKSKKECLELIKLQEARIEEITLQYEETLATLPKQLTYTDYEKTFVKSVKNAISANDIRVAVIEYFANYNLDVSNTSFLSDIMSYCYSKKVSTTSYCLTGGKNTLVNDGSGMLSKMISFTFEKMCQVGIVKPIDIPVILRDKYFKKPTNK